MARHASGADGTYATHGHTRRSALGRPSCPDVLSPITTTAYSASATVVPTPSSTRRTRMFTTSRNTWLSATDPSPSCP